MYWLLTLTIMTGGVETRVPVGLLTSESLCGAAGVGIAYNIATNTPGASVGWECTAIKEGEA